MRRCLEKTADQRFQSAKDLSFALSALSGSDSSAIARAIPPPSKTGWLRWALVTFSLVAVAAATWMLAPSRTERARLQFAIPVSGEYLDLAISPDGKMLAFVSFEETSAQPMLYVQRIGSPGAILLPGTEGAAYPFWSPDDNFIGFFANGMLQKIAATGGTTQMLAKVTSGRGGSWSRKNVIVYSPQASDVLWR